MPKRLDPDAVADLRRAHPGLTQRELADRLGVSQATISRAVRGESDDDLDHVDDDLDHVDDDEDQEQDDADRAIELSLTSVEDLEGQILDLARTARRAERRYQFGAAVAARKLKAKLRVDLEAARELERNNRPTARAAEPDEVLIDGFAALVEELPEPAFERVEDAVTRRRRRAIERDPDGS